LSIVSIYLQAEVKEYTIRWRMVAKEAIWLTW